MEFCPLPRLLSLQDFPPLTKIIGIAFLAVAALLMVRLISMWLESRGPHSASRDTAVPDQIEVAPRAVLTTAEATIFNLLYLAARDSFLILAKVPLRSLVKLVTEDDTAKKMLARQLQKCTIDFVLLHPGSLTPAKIIMVDDRESLADRAAGQSLVESLCREAHVDVIRLSPTATYTVPQLIGLLGLEEET